MSKKIIITFIISVFAIAAMILLTGCEKAEEVENTEIAEQTEYEEVVKKDVPSKETMYGEMISNYEKAVKEYDLNDIDIDEKIKEKYGIRDTSLLMHLARYASEGVSLSKGFYDIDRNGVDELILGVDKMPVTIYSYDLEKKEPVFVYALDTIERGSMTIYNGIFCTEGSGGAALHVYNFMKIADDEISAEILESVEEEYVEGSEVPEYRALGSKQRLEYKSIDELYAKYITEAKEVKVFGE